MISFDFFSSILSYLDPYTTFETNIVGIYEEKKLSPRIPPLNLHDKKLEEYPSNMFATMFHGLLD